MKKPEGSLINYFSRMVKKHGGINLAQGRPGFNPPPELLKILKENSNKGDLHQYAPGNGNFHLLELLTEKYRIYHPFNTENFLVVNGATEGLLLSFLYITKQLTKPYSSLSFDPVYESYPKISELFDIPFEYFDLKEDLGVDFNRLEKVIKEKKVKIIFLASPGNPLGKVWTQDEMNNIVTLSERYHFYFIYDAVYNDIYFESTPFNPLIFNHEKLFYINSFSKMLSISGWRIGYIIANKDHMIKIRSIHNYTSVSSPSIFQDVIAQYLSQYDYGKTYIQIIRNNCKHSYQLLKKELDDLGFRVPNIQGGYFIWAKLPAKYRDAFKFAQDLYQKCQVGVVPGENFSNTKTNFIRLNIGNESHIIEEAANRIKTFFIDRYKKI